MTPLVLIPHYNHSETLPALLAAVRTHGLPLLIVDDGSDSAHRKAAAQLAAKDCFFLARAGNGGKGAAVKDGFRWAQAHNYSHALQIDADGQHDLADIPRFLALAREAPAALVCGQPCYGGDAPKSRLIGRKITNFWIWVNTGSRDLPDGMCGYRLYPVAAVNALLARHHVGNRMDFDTEILVHAFRERLPLLWLPTEVRYPPAGRSHFRLWRDNLMISLMHARLFFSGLWWRLFR